VPHQIRVELFIASWAAVYCLLHSELQFIVSCVLSQSLLVVVSWAEVYCLLCLGLQFIVYCVLGCNLLFIVSWATVYCLLCPGPHFIFYCVLGRNLLFIFSWVAIYCLLYPGPQFSHCLLLWTKKLFFNVGGQRACCFFLQLIVSCFQFVFVVVKLMPAEMPKWIGKTSPNLKGNFISILAKIAVPVVVLHGHRSIGITRCSWHAFGVGCNSEERMANLF